MIKVLEFIGTMGDGGAETLVKDYCLMLDKGAFCPIVLTITPTAGTANSETLRKNNIKMVSIYPRWNLFWQIVAKFFHRFFYSIRFLWIIKKYQIDVIHVHLALLENILPIRQHLKGKKVFYTCHNLPTVFFDGKRIKEGVAAEKLIKNNNLQIIALHDDMAKEINERFNINDTVVIHNGIDFKRFTNIQDSKEDIRKELGIPQDAYVIGHVGRFSDQKNHHLIIDAFNETSKKNDKAFLLLVGSGPLKEEIINKVNSFGLSNKVLFLEHRTDIPQIMKAMDVFFFPSKFEGLGIVLIEAQVVGLPCVVSNQIPHEAFKSKNITKISLDVAPDIWADNLLNPVGNISEWGDISEYDMNKEIKKLEKLYNGEYDGK